MGTQRRRPTVSSQFRVWCFPREQQASGEEQMGKATPAAKRSHLSLFCVQHWKCAGMLQCLKKTVPRPQGFLSGIKYEMIRLSRVAEEKSILLSIWSSWGSLIFHIGLVFQLSVCVLLGHIFYWGSDNSNKTLLGAPCKYESHTLRLSADLLFISLFSFPIFKVWETCKINSQKLYSSKNKDGRINSLNSKLWVCLDRKESHGLLKFW